ncbi:MMPL family transporter [Actinomadura sp. 6N118]|uniref:MMPL family transporter n=1 Tax=Actinomadura sp. 6N118 TaxID=3375151 RepID=UPI0037AF6285
MTGSLMLLPSLAGDLDAPSLRVAGSPADVAAGTLERGFPELGTEQMVLAFSADHLAADDTEYLAAVQAGLEALTAGPGIGAVQFLPPAVGQDQRHLYVLAGLQGGEKQWQARLPARRAALQRAVARTSEGRVRVSLASQTAMLGEVKRADQDDFKRAELVAVPLALVVLIAGLGSLGAGLVPLLMAGVTVAVTSGVLALSALAFGLHVDTLMLTVAATIGLGLGLDYGLLLLLRYRRHQDVSVVRRAGEVLEAAGRTVVWCACAVFVAAGTLLMVEADIIRALAISVMVAAVLAPLVTLTLLPALLGAFPRLAAPPRRKGEGTEEGGWERWARHLMRRPVRYTVLAGGLLVLAVVPVAGLRLGLDFDRNSLRGTDPGRAIAQMESDRIAGITVLALPHRGRLTEVSGQVERLRADPRVSVVVPVDNGRDLTAVLIATRSASDHPAMAALVEDLRPMGQVAGAAAVLVDLKQECSKRLWQVAALVLGCSLVFLMAALRSVLLPVKAVVMNVLATGAAFGLLALVTDQQVNVLLPLLTFTLVFGLSMDYEVFLVHRIAEHYRTGGDNTDSVALGLRDTARPITLAAAVLIVTFAALLTADRQELRQLGFLVAVAVTLDVTLIRLVLVPALMRLLGRWNWWLPLRAECLAERHPVAAGAPR